MKEIGTTYLLVCRAQFSYHYSVAKEESITSIGVSTSILKIFPPDFYLRQF